MPLRPSALEPSARRALLGPPLSLRGVPGNAVSVFTVIDALAMERQFVDHLAPIWSALPERGRFLVDPSLVEHAASIGLAAEPSPRPVPFPAYPPPRFDGPPLLVASYGDVKVGRRLGYGPFAFIEHGAGQTYNGDRARRRDRSGSYAGGGDRDDNELILVPNQHAAQAWRAAYPRARVEIVGSPRLDSLPAREPGPGPVVAVSFHWPASSVSPEAGTALGEFAPVMDELAQRFTVIGHAHPKGDWPLRMARLYRRWGIEFVADFADVCRRADVYVCDNSTTLYEFAATGRPVVVMNAKAYRKRVEHGLRFWEAADVGIQVDEPGLLAAAIDNALLDAPKQREARERALAIVYAFRSGGAERAAAAITKWLATREAVAA